MLRVSCLALWTLVSAGCSGGLELHPVAGTFTLDGNAVEGANIVFHPEAADAPLAAGKTDAQGAYKLRTREQEGAPPGKYKVTVLLTKTVGQRKDPEKDDDLKMVYIVPKKYSVPETSGLEAEVPRKEPYDFKLTSR